MTSIGMTKQIIDAHQHFWFLQRGDYGWLTPDKEPLLYQDFMPERIKPELLQYGVAGTVVVQAAPTMEETEFLLGLCEQDETLLGVVGWLDISSKDFEHHFARFRANRRFVGIRPNFPNVPDGDWGRHPQLLHNLSILADEGFPVDLLIAPSDLFAMGRLLEQVPNLVAIVDHLASPDIANMQYGTWAIEMSVLAQFEHTVCKLSGLGTCGGGGTLRAPDVAPYVKHVVQIFGPDRLLFGSDWPVCLKAGSFGQMLEMVRDALPRELTEAQKRNIFGGNALKVYRLPV
ncbi:amidohydrolase family protein [Cohnella silvisoli]|uniref:Amidohydrolase family protein n=1 Tax=Cohnella silvisoli TaxID=2873699 RepID=A0ABV1KVT4_9BACL|nr:amidohydrolase family protein [Cohnella silvisoli]MCD9023510.1 amidohydrolase family protein [Cohnella silvisoli]